MFKSFEKFLCNINPKLTDWLVHHGLVPHRELLAIEFPRTASSETVSKVRNLMREFQKAGKIHGNPDSCLGGETHSNLSGITAPGAITDEDIKALKSAGCSVKVLKLPKNY